MSRTIRPIIEHFGPTFDIPSLSNMSDLLHALAEAAGCELREGFDELDGSDEFVIFDPERFFNFLEGATEEEIFKALASYTDEEQAERAVGVVMEMKEQVPAWRAFQKNQAEDYLHLRVDY